MLKTHLCLFPPQEPYLDLTCVASQAVVPTAANSSLVTISAFSPLANSTYRLGTESRRSFNPERVGGFRCAVETDSHHAETTVIVSTEDGTLSLSLYTELLTRRCMLSIQLMRSDLLLAQKQIIHM